MAQQKGWDAKDKLKPLWQQLPGKRDELAHLSGVRGTELSSHNTGKPLGREVAQKIIDGFAKAGIIVSNLELGAPLGEADEAGKTLWDLLESLQATVAAQDKTIASHGRSIRNLQSRVRDLSQALATAQTASEGR